MKTILFQGDSITDALRSREVDHWMGFGYATMTAGKIGLDYPGKYRFLNRGISGNRSTDLYARIKSDTINLKPDILTVLIGVNDVCHEFAHQNGVSAPKFEKILDMYITEVKDALPDIQIFILEPFLLNCGREDADYLALAPEVALRAQGCRNVAKKHMLTYVPLQQKLTQLAQRSTPEQVLRDGIHPTCVGHELISRELYNALKAIL